MKLKIYTPAGESKETISVDEKIFKVLASPKLTSQVVKAILANRRRPLAHTKDRSEVAGSGRKPFRQKGTGRARAGSIRSPLWVGGGITFGPRKNRNFSQRIPKKMRRQALKAVLSDKVKNNQLIIVSRLVLPQPKTKQIQQFLEKLPIKEGKILVPLAKTNVNLELATANIPYVKTVYLSGLNLIDLLKHDYVVIDKESFKVLEGQLSEKGD